MEAPSLIGPGIGFAAIGLVFVLLSVHKPNMKVFQREQGKKRWQSQGVYLGLGVFGLPFFLPSLMGKFRTL